MSRLGPGARDARHTGEHVSLVQYALMRLLVADLAASETNAMRYGAETAAAVLKYKRHLGIVNPAYQKVEDNIVGKMTIKSLDDMMWVLEGGDGLERLELHPESSAIAARAAQPAQRAWHSRCRTAIILCCRRRRRCI